LFVPSTLFDSIFLVKEKFFLQLKKRMGGGRVYKGTLAKKQTGGFLNVDADTE